MSDAKITIVGSGYVGFSLSILLSQQNEVLVYDIDKERVSKINNKISPIVDSGCEFFLKNKRLKLKATSCKDKAYKNCDFIIVATPTNYDENSNFFDVSTIDGVLDDISSRDSSATIIIKSTIPVGYTEQVTKKYKKNILFSPEFLREGSALHDNLEPARIIISSNSSEAIKFVQILNNCASKENIPVLYMSPKEAESVKLFSNSYLAMRVAFFNELDTYALENKLNPKNIIDGVCSDDRIGNGYNNPSFGYGGYCLPKDTKQLLSNFQNIPQNLIQSIIESNETRIKYISEKIFNQKPKVVGIYRLTMKSDSDNFREASIIKVIENLSAKNISIIIYEPLLESSYNNFEVCTDLKHFKNISDIIIANRASKDLDDVSRKVFSRDIFNRD